MGKVFRDTPNVYPYIDAVIIGSTGANEGKFAAHPLADVTRVLEVKEKNQLICIPSKSKFFSTGSLWDCSE